MVLGVSKVNGMLWSLTAVVSGTEKVRLVAVVPYSTLPWLFSCVVQLMTAELDRILTTDTFWAWQEEALTRY